MRAKYGEVWIEVFTGDDGVPVVQVDTSPKGGNVRVWLNDGLLFEGDPEK